MIPILCYLGMPAREQGIYRRAETYFGKGLALAEQVGDCELICALLIGLGKVTYEYGDHERAEKHFQEGLALARNIQYPVSITVLLRYLGVVLEKRGMN